MATAIDMECNIKKTVAIIFHPRNRARVIATEFPLLKVGDSYINYVSQFKYLGRIVSCDMTDDEDIEREVKNMFIRTNILIRKFNKCSVAVKTTLFKSFCLCFYDIALWKSFKVGTMNKFRSCYNKCVKLWFGYQRSYSVTAMLFELAIPTFDTIIINAKQRYRRCCITVQNSLVACAVMC